MDFWSNKSIARDLIKYTKIAGAHSVDSIFNIRCLETLADSLPFEDHCEIEEIVIDFYDRKPIAKTVPKIKAFKISLINSLFSIPGACLDTIDPIRNCTFDLVITGFCDAIEGKEYINCWHLDKDIREEDDGKHKYTHPLYHFQFGGNHLADVTDINGILLMGAPRIPHPPMDIFLSIHFILNNYFNKNEETYSFLNDFFNDTDYQDIMSNAKKRMWYPYFKALSNDQNVNVDLNLANLFPLAV